MMQLYKNILIILYITGIHANTIFQALSKQSPEKSNVI